MTIAFNPYSVPKALSIAQSIADIADWSFSAGFWGTAAYLMGNTDCDIVIALLEEQGIKYWIEKA